APYKPNTLDGGNPFTADPDDDHTFVEIAQELPKSVKERRSPVSFDDHFTQARMFWLSLTPVEQSHLVDAFTFELGKCWDETIRQREVDVLAAVDAELAQRVASGLGLSPGRPNTPPADDVAASPALSQIGEKWPVDGRRVGIVTGPKTDPK
ncbi:catalase HPII, partial [Geobacillus sp. MMMUD3]|nr:catalase HPII [Geobacillus sp. MMMUD3]